MSHTDSAETVRTAGAGAERWAPRRGATGRLLAAELRLVLGRRRNQVFVAGLGLVPVLLGVMLYLTRDDPSASEGSPLLLAQATQNGVFLVVASLFMCLPFLLPLTVALACGDAVAGEASAGTLRYLLVLPVGRTKVLVTKAVAALVFVEVAVAVVAVMGLVAGAVLFGLHDVVLLSGTTVPLAEGMARVLGVVVYVGVSLTGLVVVGLFVSTLTEVPVAAMVATVVVSVVSTILDSLPALSAIHPYLLTHYWYGFGEFLRLEVGWGVISSGLALQVAWIVVFGTLAWARFTSADISS
ncbi:MAG: ABC transporter permease subunit [Micrococcales bacterium]|nr:ABC transporter permease subunit [Micrococcales bacterium]MCL2666626.1 ABC transporter permease subunit [Micrococcales bacterium]